MKNETVKGQNRFLQNISTDSKGVAFLILENHSSTPIRKEKLIPTSKARREAIEIKFVKKYGVSDKVESSGKVDSSENHPKTRPGFVKPIRNRLGTKKNLSRVDRPGRKPTWREEKMELDSKKWSRCDRIMRSNSFET